MGVLPCHREWCDNIMCSTYIPDVGYICDDCKEEFKASVSNSPAVTGDHNIISSLQLFMDTRKKSTYTNNGTEIDEFFSKHTRFK